MSNVRIVTDSTADLPREIVEEYGITVIPLRVHFGKEIYLDGVNLQAEEFFNKLQASKELPTTSPPTPGEFLDYYQPLVEEEAPIVSIHISSKMSETLQSAHLAKQALNYEDLEIYDSRTVCAPLGLLVIAAARAARDGKSKEEIMALLDRLSGHECDFYFVVDTLEYLKRGGRISLTRAFFGSLLNVKPVCTVSRGLVLPQEKPRGRSKAKEKLVQMIEENYKNEDVWAFFSHGNAPEDIKELQETIKGKLNIKESFENLMGPVVGTHAGPDMIGMAVCRCGRLS